MPNWWTPVRRAVMEALLARSEIKVRMRSLTPGSMKTPRWRPHAPGMKTRHLFMGERADSPLTAESVGPAIKSLIDWGYIYKLSTSVPQVMFSPKGWAWPAAEKLIEPAWIDMIFDPDDYPTDRNTTWELYRKMRKTRDAQENRGMAQEEPKPQAEDDLPLLPRYDDQVEGILAERAKDGDQVARITLQLARDFHNKTSPALGNVEPQKIAEAIREHFTPEEVVRADLELARRVEGVKEDSFFSRLLVSRMSAAGQFKQHSLADHLGHGGVRHPGIARGVERISMALEMEELREEGLARHLPPETTLGDVHDRLQRESIVGVGLDQYSRSDAIADIISHENDWRRALAIARDEAQTQDDHDYWQRQLNVLDKIVGALEVPEEPATGEGLQTAFTGAALVLKRNDLRFEDRPFSLTAVIDSDYDPEDTANMEAWFTEFINRGMGRSPTRSYSYPPGANVDHQIVGEVEHLAIRSVNPLWMVAMAFGSAFAALIMFVVLLSFLPPLRG